MYHNMCGICFLKPLATTKKFKAKEMKELRGKAKKDLLQKLEELKKELHTLRVQQASDGAPAKIAQIRTLRKNIARILTILTQVTRQKAREQYAKGDKKSLPLDLRPKLTRRERLRLPQQLRFKKTPQQKRLIKKFPQRKFAVLSSTVSLPAEIQSINLKSALTGKNPGSKFHKYATISKKALTQDRERRRQLTKTRIEERKQKKQKQAQEKPQEKPAEAAAPQTQHK
ncbi:hypothetical protein RFI_26541 [Reticulomyxa filosa]|uniref:60S ribosomal protein L35 n=1 Tax=Reticulomyxa filosa TaxID=46433 RepID=X6MCS3_RETFI|nr:hypothetical protein RFI_26541 [Reticulomyxa filosa]|eukprot:ETO10835.1 hypothetical protein RFI_26541 [Reticulomyxa filosa]